MAVQNAFHKRKSVGRQVFISVFIATVILAFLLLSYIGFTMMENILMSCIVLLSAFVVSIVASVSVTNRISPHHVGLISTNGYAAPTAFTHNSRHYAAHTRPKVINEPNLCKRCGQIMLAGISTCPKCGWYKNHGAH